MWVLNLNKHTRFKGLKPSIARHTPSALSRYKSSETLLGIETSTFFGQCIDKEFVVCVLIQDLKFSILDLDF